MQNKEEKDNIRSLFKKYIKNVKDINQLLKLKELIEKFNNLDEKSQLSLINEFTEMTIKKQKENGKIICDREGHIWQELGIRTYKEIEYDKKTKENVPITYDELVRVCTRCGKAEANRVIKEEIKQKNK